MELRIINKGDEPLLSRVKIEAEMVFEKSTPSRAEIKSKLAKDLGKDEKLVVVKGIYTLYGLKKAKNIAYDYENEESLKRIEVKTKKKVKKKTPKEVKEKAEEKQKPKKEEAKEEPKQEAKQKEKPKAEAKQEGKKPEEQKKVKEEGK